MTSAMAARNELGQVTFCFSISVVLFAAIIFYTEEHVDVPYDKPFLSIPHRCLCVAPATHCNILHHTASHCITLQ